MEHLNKQPLSKMKPSSLSRHRGVSSALAKTGFEDCHTMESSVPRGLHCLLLLVFVLPMAGCFSPQSFPMQVDHLVQPTSAQLSAPGGDRLDTRLWVETIHRQTAPLLPAKAREALFSNTLRDAQGRTIDIYQHFRLREANVDALLGNLQGLEQTAQVTGPPLGGKPSPMWTGFKRVTLPSADGWIPHARLGTPDPAYEIPGSYVIITHGMFGSLEGPDMENHVQALRRAGHHVLAIEMRGHGQVGERSRALPITFGLRETADLLTAAQWLKTKHHAQRVGLVAFSVYGFESLLAAWLDAAPLGPADAARPILRNAPAVAAEPTFNGGMFIVSAPVGIQKMSNVFAKRWGKTEAPVKWTFQKHVENRLREFGDPPPRSIWDFIIPELRRDGWTRAYASETKLRSDMEWYLDLRTNNWSAGTQRLELARTPILVLSAANDPLATAQDVADLFSRVNNPNIGVILLSGGGHMGFPALSANYYYSLMKAFFDPATAPRRVGCPAALPAPGISRHGRPQDDFPSISLPTPLANDRKATS